MNICCRLQISMGYPILVLAIVLLILILQDSVVDGKPYDLWANFKSLIPTTETDCDRNAEIETLCQRCAKQTKSNLVYPMCCENREEAREWCQKYMNFGLQ
ncbi:UNVERIFIED_CONTAM: hypothetical protein PYX00_006115 [Menopon gallinae]|uniref:Uncharacterized protein n=1 Tax=Menopon gallinae TaxID=328185 RepID=A0AAW2HU34_9NEOP